MARLILTRFNVCSNYMINKLPVRRISTTRRLLSQDWQQEGIPGSNLPFSLDNKYRLTLVMTLYFTSGLGAPFILFAIAMKRIYTPPVPLGVQVLTSVVCPEGAEVK